MAKFLLIDGFNLAFRSFYGIRELSRSDGFPTNAIHGWLRTLWYLIDTYKPDHMPVFFDLGGSQNRLAIHPEYKANRSETPEDLSIQLPYLKKITQALGLPIIEQNGTEADDLIASAAVSLAKDNHSVFIVSSDKDLAQVLSQKITQLLPPPTANPKLGWRTLDPAGVKTKFGVDTHQIVDYLSLIGDTSDNIPGVQGVGPKTAVKWIQEYNNIDTIIQKTNYIAPKRFQLILPDYKDILPKNKQLITLNTNLPLPKLENTNPNTPTLLALLQELEMKKAHQEAQKRYHS